jgi:hypothetical protein
MAFATENTVHIANTAPPTIARGRFTTRQTDSETSVTAAALQNARPPIRSRSVRAEETGCVKRVFQLHGCGPCRLAEIRARLLHEPDEREGREPEALRMKLKQRLPKSVALMTGLIDRR